MDNKVSGARIIFTTKRPTIKLTAPTIAGPSLPPRRLYGLYGTGLAQPNIDPPKILVMMGIKPYCPLFLIVTVLKYGTGFK